MSVRSLASFATVPSLTGHRMQKSGSRTNPKPPKSFPVSGLTLDDLVKHCVFDHPMFYADVTGLTIEQVKELQKLLFENML